MKNVYKAEKEQWIPWEVSYSLKETSRKDKNGKSITSKTENAIIFAQTDGVPHNTITPIARMVDGKFQMDLVLRNNITTDEHPDGLYHPHAELHHIKKENIGLIEVMGLAVLPARLKDEMAKLGEILVANGEISGEIEKHTAWANKLQEKYIFTNQNVNDILEEEIGKVFECVLEHAGVYKSTEKGRADFMKFIYSI